MLRNVTKKREWVGSTTKILNFALFDDVLGFSTLTLFTEQVFEMIVVKMILPKVLNSFKIPKLSLSKIVLKIDNTCTLCAFE